MPDENFASLSDDQLVERGAALETERAEIHAELTRLRQGDSAARLLKPGVKLGINGALSVAGLALAPLTLNLSLGLTIIGMGMSVWDGLGFVKEAAEPFRAGYQARRLRRRGRDIDAALQEIEAILTARLGPP